MDLAVRFFEHYLGATGTPQIVGRDEALQIDLVATAVEANIDLFKTQNFPPPNSGKAGYAEINSVIAGGQAATAQFTDFWKYDFSFSPKRAKRYLEGLFGDPSNTLSFIVGSGSSHLVSTGNFSLRCQAGRILVNGTITHVWSDQGYDFDPGKFFASDARKLEKAGLAKPFSWKAVWEEELTGSLNINSVATGTSGPVLQWVNFDVTPKQYLPQ